MRAKTSKAVVLGAVAMLGLTVQARAQEFPKAEISFDYSLVHFNPSFMFNEKQSHNLNGGGGAAVLNVNEYFGVKAEFNAGTSVTTSFSVPQGTTLPSGFPLPGGTTLKAQGNLFTYLFGPQVKYHGRIQPFAEALFGGAHSNLYASLFRQGHIVGKAPSDNAFTVALGGGVDIPVSKSVSLRPVQFDYLLTTFNNLFSTAHQNNVRFLAGVVVNVGK